MKGSKIILIVFLVLLGFCAWYYFLSKPLKPRGSFTAAEKSGIEKIVHDYLTEHPEILVKVSQELQKRERQKKRERAKVAISANVEQLIHSNSPEIGNSKGNIVLIKFLDYQCGHCKRMEPIIEELIQDNSNLRVVIKAMPIFGEGSRVAIKAALAAIEQGKFQEMHEALLREGEKLDKEKVLELAKGVGLDIDKLQVDMEATKVDTEVKSVLELAKNIAITGTPFFIVMSDPPSGEEATFIVPGATQKSQLQALIDKVK